MNNFFNNLGKSSSPSFFKLENFHNAFTMNIFSDASMDFNNKVQHGCYGAVAVVGDTIVDSSYRFGTETTVNESEVRGLRHALSLANKYKNTYRNINIFSDSLITIKGIKEYIYSWKYNPKDGLLYGASGQVVANQGIFIECYNMYTDLVNSSGANIHIYHQSGHVNSNSIKQLNEVADKFKTFNRIKEDVDIEFVKYISRFNEYIDVTTRTYLHSVDFNNKEFTDAIIFKPTGNIS